MIRSSFAVTNGLKLARTPSAREQARRRLLVAGGLFLSLALAGVGFGLVTAPHDAGTAAATGPFSYFPSE